MFEDSELIDIFLACSFALDCIERELVGVTSNHGKRVAAICLRLSERFGMTELERAELAGCAVLHDSALTQFLKKEEEDGEAVDPDDLTVDQLSLHCVMGEQNIRMLPFKTDVENAVLYHHENADGSGVFGKTVEQTPLKAQLIHFADTLDVTWHLDQLTPQKYEELLGWLDRASDVLFSAECVLAFKRAFAYEMLAGLQDDAIDQTLKDALPGVHIPCRNGDLINVATLFARIIDYKSPFTCRHSLGIAEKAKRMAEYYGYVPEKADRMYFAGALHDIGKLVVGNEVLEKPGRLTPEEYRYIQEHAMASYQILSGIAGMEDVTRWAALHHEKLDGTGYPFGLKARDLSWESRVMCCLDIYQALTEDRPYKPGMTHEKTLGIMNELVEKGQLDGAAVHDVDLVFAE